MGYKIKQCDSDVCDFCAYYDFNGEDGMYVGKGFCNKHVQQKDPEDFCDSFICEFCNPKIRKKIREVIDLMNKGRLSLYGMTGKKTGLNIYRDIKTGKIYLSDIKWRLK